MNSILNPEFEHYLNNEFALATAKSASEYNECFEIRQQLKKERVTEIKKGRYVIEKYNHACYPLVMIRDTLAPDGAQYRRVDMNDFHSLHNFETVKNALKWINN